MDETKVNNTPKKDRDENRRKKDIIASIIIILILLLLAAGVYFILKNKIKPEDPDVTVVRIMNESYQIYEQANGKVTNEHDAHQVISSRGYVIERGLILNEDRIVVWDSINDCFNLLENGKVIYSPVENPTTKGEDLWVFTKTVPESSKYNIFWCGTEKVKKQEVVGKDKKGKDILVEKEYVYTDHDYTRTKSNNATTYLCEECGHTYTVKKQ